MEPRTSSSSSCAVLAAAAMLALALANEHGGRLQRALRPAGPWLAAPALLGVW